MKLLIRNISVFLIPVILLVHQMGVAQRLEPLPEESKDFIKALRATFEKTGSPAMKETADLLKETDKDVGLSGKILDGMITTINQMIKKGAKLRPEIYDYTRAVCYLAGNDTMQNKFKDWNLIIDSLLMESNRGVSQNLKRYLDFSVTLFQHNAFYESNSKWWQVSAQSWEFGYEGGDPYMYFDLTDLFGFSDKDTFLIKETAGSYYPFSELWYGSGGTFTWEGVGLDETEVWAELGDYVLRIPKGRLLIDSVMLKYPEILGDQEVLGQIEDQLRTSGNGKFPRYPKFSSYEKGYRIPNIFEGVDYFGSFKLAGRTVRTGGSPEAPSFLKFYNQSGELVAEAHSDQFIIDLKEKFIEGFCELSLYTGKDSLFATGVNLQYDPYTRTISALKVQDGPIDPRISSSYHNIDLTVDRVDWQIDSDSIIMNNHSISGEKKATFESIGNFDPGLYQKYWGIQDYNQLQRIDSLSRKLDTKKLSSDDVADAFHRNLAVEQIRRSLWTLQEDGFITYDRQREKVYVRDKLFRYVEAANPKKDHDIIKFHSESPGEKDNATIDLKTGKMQVNGVNTINVSEKKYVHFFPRPKAVQVDSNRDMTFSGTVFAGKLDIYGIDFDFKYIPFTVEMPQIDSIGMNEWDVPPDSAPGSVKLRPIRSIFENAKGKLRIDYPYNKAGKTEVYEFSKFISSGPANIFYNHHCLYRNVYDRDRFYVTIDSLYLDSLDKFSVYHIRFPGTLTSGIFPEIRDTVQVMPDTGLGFYHLTPPNGYPCYDGAGTYYGTIDLSWHGLKGDGKLEYLSAIAESRDFTFFSDSAFAPLKTFEMAEKTIGSTSFPAVRDQNSTMYWTPFKGNMHVTSDTTPFNMFYDVATLDGSLNLGPGGLNGAGILDWPEARMQADEFRFASMSLRTDTASLNIKSNVPGVDAFDIPNVGGRVNFKQKTGSFVSNDRDEEILLPLNQFKTDMYAFEWDMETRDIYFSPVEGVEFSTFTSTHPDQNGLQILAKNAAYDLDSFQLKVNGVPYIQIGDMELIPGDGQVRIGRDAKILPLKNARIEIDSNHSFVHVDADILGSNDYKASGDYPYLNRGGQVQTIHFQEVGMKKDDLGDRTYAVATIDEEQEFELDPAIQYVGDVKLDVKDPYLRFEGLAKPQVSTHRFLVADWFRISQLVNPSDVALETTNSVTKNGKTAYAGIWCNAGTDSLFTTFLGPRVYKQDRPVFLTGGVMIYDDVMDEYLIAPKDWVYAETDLGNMLIYSRKTGQVTATGVTDFGMDFNRVNFQASGRIIQEKESPNYQFSHLITIDLPLVNDLARMVHSDLYRFAVGNRSITYTDDDLLFMSKIMENMDDIDMFYEDLDVEDVVIPPPSFDEYGLVIKDIEFKYYPEYEAYMYSGPVGVVMSNGRMVEKVMEAKIRLKYESGGDEMDIHLSGRGGYYYFSYKRNKMKILSSSDEFNTVLTNLNDRLKTVKESKDRYIEFGRGTETQMDEFLTIMEAQK